MPILTNSIMHTYVHIYQHQMKVNIEQHNKQNKKGPGNCKNILWSAHLLYGSKEAKTESNRNLIRRIALRPSDLAIFSPKHWACSR